MHTRRALAAMLTAALFAVLTAVPVAAAKPTRPPADPPPEQTERPLTAEEEAASERKLAAAHAYLASVTADGSARASLSCVTPTSTTATTSTVSPKACYVPQGYLSVTARDQEKWYYCGPAVGQVIANYSWAVKSTANKYTQAAIAKWMATDANGQTAAYAFRDGLERATAGSPRRPANWAWVVTDLRDTDGDGALGDQLQDYVRSNVSGSKMPLAVSVKPHDPKGTYHLPSWTRPIASGGHWIGLYGWYSYWTGSDFARVYYTDSSKDEGGSTGKFWLPTRNLAEMIRVHNGRFVW